MDTELNKIFMKSNLDNSAIMFDMLIDLQKKVDRIYTYSFIGYFTLIGFVIVHGLHLF